MGAKREEHKSLAGPSSFIHIPRLTSTIATDRSEEVEEEEEEEAGQQGRLGRWEVYWRYMKGKKSSWPIASYKFFRSQTEPGWWNACKVVLVASSLYVMRCSNMIASSNWDFYSSGMWSALLVDVVQIIRIVVEPPGQQGTGGWERERMDGDFKKTRRKWICRCCCLLQPRWEIDDTACSGVAVGVGLTLF